MPNGMTGGVSCRFYDTPSKGEPSCRLRRVTPSSVLNFGSEDPKFNPPMNQGMIATGNHTRF